LEGADAIIEMTETFTGNGKIGGVTGSGKGYTVSFGDAAVQKQFDKLQQDYNSRVESAIAKIPEPDVDISSITSQEEFNAASGQLKAYNDQVTFTRASFGPSPLQQVINHLPKNQNEFTKREETERLPSLSPGMR